MKYDIIKKAFDKYSYDFYTKPNSINIFGIRANNSTPNSFDDLIGVVYNDSENIKRCEVFEATTDAGITVLGDRFGGADGTLIMIAGQYYKMFKKGFHKGKYPALQQNIKIEVIRDKNKDDLLSFDSLARDYGMFGLNLHHAGVSKDYPSIEVNNWSYGCQVIRKITDWIKFWGIIEMSSSIYGNEFTYTLFEDRQFDNELISSLR